MTNPMPVMSGRILPNNTLVSVLRDTGCSTCVNKSSLVKPKQTSTIADARHQEVLPSANSISKYRVTQSIILMLCERYFCLIEAKFVKVT